VTDVAVRLREKADAVRGVAAYESGSVFDQVETPESLLLDLLADAYEQLAWQVAPETRALLARVEELAT
jgi:uncharacterized Fe-S cluster-containing MiaB family protein